jgi:hypothetical protein
MQRRLFPEVNAFEWLNGEHRFEKQLLPAMPLATTSEFEQQD